MAGALAAEAEAAREAADNEAARVEAKQESRRRAAKAAREDSERAIAMSRPGATAEWSQLNIE